MAYTPKAGEFLQVVPRGDVLDEHGRPLKPAGKVVSWSSFWDRRYAQGDVDVFRVGGNHIAADADADAADKTEVS